MLFFFNSIRSVIEAVYPPGHQLAGGWRIEGIPDKCGEPPAGFEGSRAFAQEADGAPRELT